MALIGKIDRHRGDEPKAVSAGGKAFNTKRRMNCGRGAERSLLPRQHTFRFFFRRRHNDLPTVQRDLIPTIQPRGGNPRPPAHDLKCSTPPPAQRTGYTPPPGVFPGLRAMASCGPVSSVLPKPAPTSCRPPAHIPTETACQGGFAEVSRLGINSGCIGRNGIRKWRQK